MYTQVKTQTNILVQLRVIQLKAGGLILIEDRRFPRVIDECVPTGDLIGFTVWAIRNRDVHGIVRFRIDHEDKQCRVVDSHINGISLTPTLDAGSDKDDSLCVAWEQALVMFRDATRAQGYQIAWSPQWDPSRKLELDMKYGFKYCSVTDRTTGGQSIIIQNTQVTGLGAEFRFSQEYMGGM